MSTSARYSSLLVAVVLATPLVYGQKIDFSFGARVGLGLNQKNQDAENVAGSTFVVRGDSRRYTFGPTLEMGFLRRFAVEFSPLFRREGATRYFDQSRSQIPTLPPGAVASLSQFSRERVNIWELPVMGKYYFADKQARFRPFIGAGFFVSRRSNEFETFGRSLDSNGAEVSRTIRSSSVRWEQGAIAGAGVNIRSGRLLIVPEFRYSRDVLSAYTGTRNRAELFLGFRF